MSETPTPRRLVFECPADGFRSSPITFAVGAEPLGLEAACIQLAEHMLVEHGGTEGVRWRSVDMPDGL